MLGNQWRDVRLELVAVEEGVATTELVSDPEACSSVSILGTSLTYLFLSFVSCGLLPFFLQKGSIQRLQRKP